MEMANRRPGVQMGSLVALQFACQPEQKGNGQKQKLFLEKQERLAVRNRTEAAHSMQTIKTDNTKNGSPYFRAVLPKQEPRDTSQVQLGTHSLHPSLQSTFLIRCAVT